MMNAKKSTPTKITPSALDKLLESIQKIENQQIFACTQLSTKAQAWEGELKSIHEQLQIKTPDFSALKKKLSELKPKLKEIVDDTKTRQTELNLLGTKTIPKLNKKLTDFEGQLKPEDPLLSKVNAIKACMEKCYIHVRAQQVLLTMISIPLKVTSDFFSETQTQYDLQTNLEKASSSTESLVKSLENLNKIYQSGTAPVTNQVKHQLFLLSGKLSIAEKTLVTILAEKEGVANVAKST